MLSAGVPSGKNAFAKTSRRKRAEMHSSKPKPSVTFKYEPVHQTVRDANQFEVVEYKTDVGVYRFVFRNTEPWVLQAPSVALSSLPAPNNRSLGLYALHNFSVNEEIGFYGGQLHKKTEERYSHALSVHTRILQACNIKDTNYVVNAEHINPPPFLGSINSSKRLPDYKPNVVFAANGGVYCNTRIEGLMPDSSAVPEEIVNLPLQDLEKHELMISYGKEYKIPAPDAGTEKFANWTNWGTITLDGPASKWYAEARKRHMQIVHSRGQQISGPFSVVYAVQPIDIPTIPDVVKIQLKILDAQVYKRLKLVCSQALINVVKYTFPCKFGYQQLDEEEFMLHKRENPACAGPVLQLDTSGNVRYFVDSVCFLQETTTDWEHVQNNQKQLKTALKQKVLVEPVFDSM